MSAEEKPWFSLEIIMPSANRQKREQVVAELTKLLGSAEGLVVVNYTGMSVGLQQDLKDRLREVGATMKVAKNTLIKIAGKEAKLANEFVADDVLVGQTALIVTEGDPIAPLQILADFAKEHEVPSMKVGIVEGTFQDETALLTLSRLPGRDVLAGQVLGALMAPSYGLVSVLNANMQKLIHVLTEASKK